MKVVLICPGERPNVAALAESSPLALAPILDKRLVEYWLEHLVGLGVKQALILAADRPDQVRAFVGDGKQWGLKLEVRPELRELTPIEARAKYRANDQASWLAEPNDVMVLDHLPALPQQPLFTNYADWVAALRAWMPRAATPSRVGMREIQPGVWVGLRTRVSPGAELRAPCWLGENVYVGPQAVIGPMAILEHRVFVDAGASISHSVVGPETYVGELTELQNSLAFGRTLINWQTDSHIKVPDPFLLCSLNEARSSIRLSAWIGRCAALLTLSLTLPLALVAILKSKLRGRPALRPLVAVRPGTSELRVPGDTLIYYELAGAGGWLRRWPQLWQVARGEFAWVGNRPLNPGQAARLSNDFERLWLAAAIGLISLADAESCPECFSDEARAHASFYAAGANWRLDLAVLARALFAAVFGARPWQGTGAVRASFREVVAEQDA
jgi:hypothetical protein